MSQSQMPTANAFQTPNAQEFLTKGQDKDGNSTFLVDYDGLLKASGGDKNTAYQALKNDKELNFDFGILDYNFNNDTAAAFEALQTQNAVLAGFKDDNERAKREQNNEYFKQTLAALNDANTPFFDKQIAQDRVFDYIYRNGFDDDKKGAELYKNEVMKPFYQQEYDSIQRLKGTEPPASNEDEQRQLDEYIKRRDEREQYAAQILNDESAQSGKEFEAKLKDFKKDFGVLKKTADTIVGATFGNDEMLLSDKENELNMLEQRHLMNMFKNGKNADELSPEMLNRLAYRYNLEKFENATSITPNQLNADDKRLSNFTDFFLRTNKKEVKEDAYKYFNQQKRIYELLTGDKKYYELNEADKRLVKKQAGFWDMEWKQFWNEDGYEKEFDKLKKEYKTAAVLVPEIQQALVRLDTISQNKSLLTQFLRDTNDPVVLAAKDRYYNDQLKIVRSFLGDKASVQWRQSDDGELETYAILPNGEALFINKDEFGTNLLAILNSMKGEIGAAIAGASYGFAKGKSAKGKVLNSMLYAAAGSAGGAAADYLLGNYLLNRDAHMGEFVEKMLEAGVMSVAGDAAVLGLGAGAKYIARNGAKALTEPINKISNGVSWIIDKSPVVGTLKRMISPEQNLDAAVKMMARNTTPEQKIAIDEAMHQIGGEMKQQPNIAFFQNIADKFRAKIGDESFLTQTAQKWADTISNRSLLQARQDMLNFVRSDESGSALKILLEVASRSDVVQKNLSNIITHTFNGLKREIENLGVKKADIQAILNEAKIGTSESFGNAMNMIAHSILPDDLFKTRLDTTRLNAFLDTLKKSESVIAESEVTKGTRAKLIERLEKDKEWTFSELRALETDLNDIIYNKNLDKGFRRHIANALNNELKAVLRDGVYSLFQQYAVKNAGRGGKAIAAKMQDLYNVALRDYADYKQLEKMVQKYKLANEERDLNQVVNALVDIMKGQGSKDGLDQLTRFTKYLSPENREVFEVAVLKKFFDEASFASKDGVRAFDSLSFFNRLKSVDGKTGQIGEVGERLIDKFQSPAAKAILNYAENFQKAFLKDYEIAYKLTNPAARESSTSILGTDLTRRGLLMAARMGWEWMRRNLGHIPFLKGFNENTQTHAFRYHLDKALREANGLEDFKHILDRRVQKAKFNNETMRQYNAFKDGIDEAIKNADDLAKMSEDELLKREIYQNLEKSQQFGRDMQSQALQNTKKSILDLARENTEKLRQEQLEKELAQKEKELAELKRAREKQAEIIAQKESRAGQSANEAQRLEIGAAIQTKPIKATKIIINDTAQPFEAQFVIAKKSDIKPNFERTGTQGRSEKQSKVIESIQNDFKPHLIFEQSGGFEGLPLITKDGQVIAGNHRAEAINQLTGENLARYKQAAKEKFNVDLNDDEVIVRLVNDSDEKELVNLAFMSNVGRESNLGEKALSNLAKFEKEMPNLPNHIQAESVDELQSIISKTLDKQGAGLNTFDTNLALFSKLAKNSSNNDILDALNKIQNLSAEEKSKILKMFVDNAGSFYNLAKDTELKNLDLRPYLNDSIVTAANSYASRAEDYARLFDDISHILSLDENALKETLKLDKHLFENLKSKALGLSFARFARLENPSSQLFEFLKNAKANLEDLNSANLFDSTGKSLDELDIYDFLKHAINQGRESEYATQIIGKLDDLRAVEQRILNKDNTNTTNKLYQKPEPTRFNDYDENGLELGWKHILGRGGQAKPELDKIYSLKNGDDKKLLSDFFRAHNEQEYTRGYINGNAFASKQIQEIFDRALGVASRLDVKVKFESKVGGRSFFDLGENTITINATRYAPQDLAHELIHATFHKGYKIYKENLSEARKVLTARQIRAYKEIEELYKDSKDIWLREHPHHYIKDANQKMPYAYESIDEFIAELSDPAFRAILKKQTLWERIGEAIYRFFTIKDPSQALKKTNAYEALKTRYFEILDDFGGKVTDNSLLTKADAQKMLKEAPQLLDEHEAQRLEIVRDLAEFKYKRDHAPADDKAFWQEQINDKEALFEDIGQKMSSIRANVEALNEYFFGIKAEPTLFAPKRDDGLSLFDDDKLFKNDELFGKKKIDTAKENLNLSGVKNIQKIENKNDLFNFAKNLQFETYAKMPKKINLDEFLQEPHSFENVENFVKHLQTRQDAKAREAYLNLIEPTKQSPDLIISTGDKKEFVKAFEYERNGKKELFNIVATEQDGKIVLSALPTHKINYIKTKIKNADSVEFQQGAIKDFTTPRENKSLTHKYIIPNSKGRSQVSDLIVFESLFRSAVLKLTNARINIDLARKAGNNKDFQKAIREKYRAFRNLDDLINSNNLESDEYFIQKYGINKLDKELDLDDYAKSVREIIENDITQNAKASQVSAKIKDLENELDEAYTARGHAIMARNPNVDEITAKINKINDELGKLKFSIDKNDLGYIDIKPFMTKQPLKELMQHIKQQASEKYQFLDKNFTSGKSDIQRQLDEIRKHIETRTGIYPLKEFGTNYAEFYKDGQGAIKKLLAEAEAAKKAGVEFKGQVAGAYEKEIDGVLSDIDLVWGNDEIGLKKIIDKHLSDFADFKGDTPQDKLINALSEIVKDGKVINEKGVPTIWHKKGDEWYLVGLSKGFGGNGKNLWIVTSYKKTKGKMPDEISGDTLNLSAYKGEFNPPLTSGDEPLNKNIIPKNETKSQGELRNSLNETLQEAFDIFKTHNKDEYENALFDRVIKVANDLDARFWEQSNPKWVNGTYTFWLNRAMIDSKLLKENPQAASRTILHELIHSTTSRAIHAYDNGLTHLLSDTQKQGIEELKNLYKVVRDKNKNRAFIDFGDRKKNFENNVDKIYGLMNEHEFLAELAKPHFREFLKGENLFTKIINAIAKIFGYTAKNGDEIATNAFKEAESALYKIMDNYEPNFTREFDDIYKSIDFVDFADYKDYLRKHTQRLQNFFEKEKYKIQQFSRGKIDQLTPQEMRQAHADNNKYLKRIALKIQAFENTFGVSFEKIRHSNNPLAKALKFIVDDDKMIVGNTLSTNDYNLYYKRTAILAGLQPFFKSGVWKNVDDEMSNFILNNIENIAQKDLKYRNKPINDFFTKDFSEKLVEKMNLSQYSVKDKGNSVIMSGENLNKGQNLRLDKFKDSQGLPKTAYLDSITGDRLSSPNLENDIIPKIANKFNKDEIWAKNLYEWHKDSSPLTKNEDGTPKVFYHATNADEKFEIFDKNKIHIGYGFWFGDNINNQAVREAKTGKAPIFKVFLQMKKPFVVLEPINKNNYKEFEKIYKRKFEREMRNNEKLAEFENFVKEKLQADEVDIGVVNFSWSIKKNGKWKTYNGKDLEKILTPELRNEAQKYLDNVIIRKIYNNDLPRAYGANPQDAKEANEIKQRLIKNGYDSIVYGDEFVVFDSNQIKSIDNTGKFDGINPNILQANQHLVAGLAGGSLNGIETDEDGNIIGFSPSKFVAGFLGGAAGSLAFKKGAKFLNENPQFKEAVANELKESLKQGWQSATKQYPLLSQIAEPKYIIQNEKGAKSQAKHLLNELEKSEVLTNLEHLSAAPLPKELNEAEFLEKGLEKVINKQSFLTHLKSKSDANTRLKYLNLVKPTLKDKDIQLKILGKNGEERTAYLKAFEYGNQSDRKLFYTLITEQDDTYLITGYPTSKIKEVQKIIKNAQSVEYFGRPTEALGTATEKKASSLNDIIPKNQTKINFLPRLEKMAEYSNFLGRLADSLGFEFSKDLPQEVKDRIYNTYIKRDTSLKDDFRIDGDDIFVGSKITPQKLNEAINELLQTPQLQKDELFINTKAKFKNFSDKKVADLLDFMKESDSFTKDKKGVPREFYHGGASDIQVFENDKSGYGFFFSSIKDEAKAYRTDTYSDDGFYKTFLKMKNPFRMDKITLNSFDEYKKALQNLGIKDITKDDYEIFLENKRFFNEIKQRAKKNGLKLSEMDAATATFIDSKKQSYFVKIYDDPTYPAISNLFKDIKPLNNGDIWLGFNNFARNEFDLALLSVNDRGVGEYANGVGDDFKDILQKQGYDSIIFNDFQVSVFNPNQIKEVKNTGSWTDSAGNITSTKPKDKSATHSFFNEQSPNILMSNDIVGGAVLGGALNGIETDENGNIIGFSPSKFVAGFLGGAGVSKATQFALKNPKFRAKADKFLQQSGDFIVNELKNPNLPVQTRQTLERIFGKALVRQMDARAFIIAGENAIGANKAKLSKAQVMQKAGKSDDEIWLKTGWYYDKDGKWKFEINPAGGEFKQDFDKISHIEYNSEGVGYEIRFNGVLSDYLDDKELFKAYPQLKEFKIVVGDIGNPQWLAEYNNKNKIFYLNTNAISKENAKSVLYHEIQHAVQDLEGFASGGNPKTALSYADETQKQKIANYKKSFAGKDLDDDAIAYKFLHGEVEARNVENRMKNMDDLKMLNEPEKAAWLEPDEIKYAHAKTKMHPYETQDIKDSIVSFHNDKDEYGRE